MIFTVLYDGINIMSVNLEYYSAIAPLDQFVL